MAGKTMQPTKKTIDQLQSELVSKRADYITAKRGNAAGELANPRAITATRKDIARLLTALRMMQDDEKETK